MIQYIKSPHKENYLLSIEKMENIVNSIIQDRAKHNDLAWFLEYNSIYTAGTSTSDQDILDNNKFPIIKTNRGGKVTYHGPGQRVIYFIIDLKRRGISSVREYIEILGRIVTGALKSFGISSYLNTERIGIWVKRSNAEDKIAAIGVRIRKQIAYHGVAVNLNNEISHYSGIVPCGIKEHGITSIHKMGCSVSMQELDKSLEKSIATNLS